MKSTHWPELTKWPEAFSFKGPGTAILIRRIRTMERDLGLAIKLLILGMLYYYLYMSRWLEQTVTVDLVRTCFVLYVFLNIVAGLLLLAMDRLPLQAVRMLVFNLSWIDALFLSLLTGVTGGHDSILFWVYLGLMVRNAVSNPEMVRQLTLNAVVTVSFIMSGVLEKGFTNLEIESLDPLIVQAGLLGPEGGAEPFVLRLAMLVLVGICGSAVQVLSDSQRLREYESREFSLRQEKLQTAGRLAAEIAHQLKNPLGIINNAAFTLQRTVKEGKTITQQIQIIREEVERSDRILTELMGYAQLTEGRVEKLNLVEELDSAIALVFPPAVKYQVQIERHYAEGLPFLLAQKGHLSEVFVNLLQNAKEAMNGEGTIVVQAEHGLDFSVTISIADTGPGIPSDKLPSVFEPYFTTKVKGTGLGLAIVKHNTELYGGSVEVESEIGKGTTFIVNLPAKILLQSRT